MGSGASFFRSACGSSSPLKEDVHQSRASETAPEASNTVRERTQERVAPQITNEIERISPVDTERGTLEPLFVPGSSGEIVPIIQGLQSIPSHSTPREHASTSSSELAGVPYTPHGDEASIFKYYCPLCMQYFKGILKMKCCGNYICSSCTRDYVGRKGFLLADKESLFHIEEMFMSSNNVVCPNCQVTGFHPLKVSSEESVRDYSYRFSPMKDVNVGNGGYHGYSPLRVGESFEDLKRKMIPYKTSSTDPDLFRSAMNENDSEANAVMSPGVLFQGLITPRADMIEVIGYEPSPGGHSGRSQSQHMLSASQRNLLGMGIAMVPEYGGETPSDASPATASRLGSAMGGTSGTRGGARDTNREDENDGRRSPPPEEKNDEELSSILLDAGVERLALSPDIFGGSAANIYISPRLDTVTLPVNDILLPPLARSNSGRSQSGVNAGGGGGGGVGGGVQAAQLVSDDKCDPSSVEQQQPPPSLLLYRSGSGSGESLRAQYLPASSPSAINLYAVGVVEQLMQSVVAQHPQTLFESQ